MKKQIIVGLFCGSLAVGLLLIVKSEDLPFNYYIYKNPILNAIFALLNLPLLLVQSMTRIDSRPFALFFTFVQWFLIGYFVAWLWRRLGRRSQL